MAMTRVWIRVDQQREIMMVLVVLVVDQIDRARCSSERVHTILTDDQSILAVMVMATSMTLGTMHGRSGWSDRCGCAGTDC